MQKKIGLAEPRVAPRVLVCLRMDKKTLADLRAVARKHGCTLSRVVRVALGNYLGGFKK